MASVRLSKQDKKDFCDHLANKLFKAEVEQAGNAIKAMGESIQMLYASPSQIDAAALLTNNMVTRKRTAEVKFEFQIGHQYHYPKLEVEMPSLTPMPTEPYNRRPRPIEFDSDHMDKWGLQHWMRKEAGSFMRNDLIPAARKYIEVYSAREQFRLKLAERMEQVTTSKKLKEAAPELYDEWVAYFGEGTSASSALALRFDDVLSIMREKQADKEVA